MHYELQFFRKTKTSLVTMFFSDYFTDVVKAMKWFSVEMQKAETDEDFYFVSELKLMRIVGHDTHPVATWKRH
tara:strand:- start:2562 stop:2780 length:219 start_codon:yes stop_codon:yes gene_type:complete